MLFWLKALIVGLLTLLLSATYSSISQPKPAENQDLVSRATIEWLTDVGRKYDLPAIALGVVASPTFTGTEWRNQTFSWGVKDSDGRAMDDQALFAIASNSKLFLAISLGLLIDDGVQLADGSLFGYDTKIKAILPEWEMMDSYATEHVTILDLLSMRSGLPRHDWVFGNDNIEEVILKMRHFKPLAELRETSQYCNFHYTILGHIVSILAGQPHHVFIQQRILDPLNLSVTFDYEAASASGKRVSPHFREGVDPIQCQGVWQEQDRMDVSCIGKPVGVSWFMEGDAYSLAGVTGALMSIQDGMTWIRELLDPKVIPEWIIRETRKHVIPSNIFPDLDVMGSSMYGQAQVMYWYRGHEIVQHGGVVPGITTQIVRVPSLGIGFMLGINDNDVGLRMMQVIVNRLLDDLIGLQPLDWESSLATELFREEPTRGPSMAIRRPSLSPNVVVGQYQNPAYGHIELKAVPKATVHDETPFAVSGELAAIIRSALHSSTIETLDQSRDMYHASLPRLWSQGLVFTHFDGPVFNVSIIQIRAKEKDGSKIGRIWGKGSAVFVEDEGIGMFDGFWRGNLGLNVVEQGVKEAAEVWFSRAG